MGAVHEPFILSADTTGAHSALRGMRGSAEDSPGSPSSWAAHRPLWSCGGWGLPGEPHRRTGEENCVILRELVRLQAQKSRLLGFCTRADSVLEMNLDKTRQVVATVLEAEAPWGAGAAVILELKKAECQRWGLHFDGPINALVLRYYMNQGEETRYHTLPCRWSCELLGLTFDLEEGTNMCHEDMRLYMVRDAASSKVVHRQVLPGPLSSVHAWGNLLAVGWGSSVEAGSHLRPSPGRVIGLPAARWELSDRHRSLVANFTKATHNLPSLLQHDERETNFHDVGHAMHHLRSQAQGCRQGAGRSQREGSGAGGAVPWEALGLLPVSVEAQQVAVTSARGGRQLTVWAQDPLHVQSSCAGDDKQRGGSGAGSAVPSEALGLLRVSVEPQQLPVSTPTVDENQRDGSGAGGAVPCESLGLMPVSVEAQELPVTSVLTTGDENQKEGSGAGGAMPCEALGLLTVSVEAQQVQVSPPPGDENQREGSGAGGAVPCEALGLLRASVDTQQLTPPGRKLRAHSYGYLCSEEGGLSGKVRGRPAAQTKEALFGLGLDARAAPLGLPGSEGPALDPLLPCPLFSHSRGGHTTPSVTSVAMDYRSCILRPGGSEDAKGR
ncbi:hypothetical protein EI555_020079, partial [Monodon monoceros]